MCRRGECAPATVDPPYDNFPHPHIPTPPPPPPPHPPTAPPPPPTAPIMQLWQLQNGRKGRIDDHNCMIGGRNVGVRG
ncbi:hypothetical protein Xph01_18940 [Micromonospora phaseoli]|nr:hypothetical protein Xph01_18940 [Micromonospora phaseoli]